ncbi:hypothetical protein ALI22I_13965 [Saccharothrix sp. ALI-22-I]|uniref:hypothetical protein n=1 Tax=Saccharothrix sp. ALI-22-I TaxID=1933778 RepID=UPI00097BEA42|nr:hypothetical protein [Saccharothrix sp. ALI-22-I]ONI90010.1 hypothetical protein ALI22I_13965 [Saccharothrix sp. ALI-22-I]
MAAGESEPETEFPHRIGKTAKRVLALEGYTRYEQLTKTTPKELLKIHGMGKKGIQILREELAARGLSFGDES